MADTLPRWRLVLGVAAEDSLGGASLLSEDQIRADRALDFLYSREYQERGQRGGEGEREGTLGPSQLAVPAWLSEVT